MESSNRAKFARLGVCALTCALASASAYAQIFKCTDDSGKVSFTDRPCASSQKSEEVKIRAAPAQPPEAEKKAADYERELQQERAERERAKRKELNQRVADAEAKVKKIKSDNYDPEKCKSARAKMDAIKRRDPIMYKVDFNYVEYQQRAELYCGN